MDSPRLRRLATIVGTFSVALAIGFVMQNGDALAARLGVNDKSSDLGSADTYQPVTASGFVQPDHDVDVDADGLLHDMNVPAGDDGAAAGCEVRFEAVPDLAATVDLTLSAPCHPETLVTVQHQGMKFNDMTDGSGNLAVQVPALSKEAYFVATVAGTNGVVAITGVQDLALYDRAVLQWKGAEALQLHALELGAAEGEAGHIWQAAAGPINDTQGFLTQLGSDKGPYPLMAEVYTYPTGMSQSDGDVTLSVRAEVTMDNCGRKVSAQSIQLHPNQPPAARNMSLIMPGCDQIGEYLVLKNMFEDLTLAAR